MKVKIGSKKIYKKFESTYSLILHIYTDLNYMCVRKFTTLSLPTYAKTLYSLFLDINYAVIVESFLLHIHTHATWTLSLLVNSTENHHYYIFSTTWKAVNCESWACVHEIRKKLITFNYLKTLKLVLMPQIVSSTNCSYFLSNWTKIFFFFWQFSE